MNVDEATRGVTMLLTIGLSLLLAGRPGFSDDQAVPGKVPPLEFVRGLDKEESVTEVREVANGIGYLRLRFFGRRTAQHLRSALQRFTSQGVQGLVIDLRDNEGGYLKSATQALDCFFPPNMTLLWEVDQEGRRIRNVSQDAFAWEKPVVLVVNERSASSAEAFAGSLRYYRKAVLIGRPTFGKGALQTITPLPRHQQQRSSVGHYVFPDGASITASGLQPDILLAGEDPLVVAVEHIKEVVMEQN